MNKLKTILFDGFILFLASTIFVLIADYGFSFLKDKGVKDAPLVTAINQEKIEKLTSLAESGSLDINQLDSHKRTALMRAAYVNYDSLDRTAEADKKRAPMIPVLITNGAAIDQQDSHGWSALMWASWSGMPLVVEQLLEAKASHELVGLQGHTALTLAAMRGNAKVIEMLTQHGANTQVQTKSEQMAIDLATLGMKKYPDKEAGYKKIITLLSKP
ncbi:ankyrin repeat domain-containing protein [Verrucomicrobiaceae bacterium N1E253]|uniref:Ankyrin repeat domain-containing protein n=1 Tax=Oceaniferula marina TaxID=2748318 RepID=A0A851GK23_9BACT|nr:ankyrin repeat domain-containing protein [Oceaniferula marina]NWK56211.1 ankyrin repeat domain-containing protein [Oceaniferula marina]